MKNNFLWSNEKYKGKKEDVCYMIVGKIGMGMCFTPWIFERYLNEKSL